MSGKSELLREIIWLKHIIKNLKIILSKSVKSSENSLILFIKIFSVYDFIFFFLILDKKMYAKNLKVIFPIKTESAENTIVFPIKITTVYDF